MEKSDLVKRLSLLEDQKNALLANITKANGIENWFREFDKASSDQEEDDDDDDSYSGRTRAAPFEKLTPPRRMVNAEETIVETSAATTLDLRVEHVEKCVYGFDPYGARRVLEQEKLREIVPLLRRVDEARRNFNTFVRDHEEFKLFFEQYDQTSKLVSPYMGAVAIERTVLTPEAKAEIVAASALEFEQVAEALKEIDSLQKFVDAPEFKGLDKMFPMLTPVETHHVKQAAETNDVSARVTQLLDRYNRIVNTISEIFISWDYVLNEVDAKLSSIERARGRD